MLTHEQNIMYMGFSAFILLLSVVIIIVGIILIHDLPYKIAKKRNHPQQDAVRCMAVMGLVMFPLWLLSMIWAYMRSGVSYFGGPAENQNNTPTYTDAVTKQNKTEKNKSKPQRPQRIRKERKKVA